MVSDGFCELIRPNYIIRDYTSGIYKVSYFPYGAPVGCRVGREHHNSYDRKLDPSISRSRRIILEKGLCNDWDYFGTFTISDSNYDRTDLSVFRKDFSQFIRDQRKKSKKAGLDSDIDFLFVPELHSDGKSWHLHGLFRGLDPLLVSFSDLRDKGYNVPDNLVNEGYFCWLDYWKKFGYCSFAPVRNRVATAFYIVKYLYKSINTSDISVGNRIVFSSTGLNSSSVHGDIYGHCTYLDQFLVNNYEFCKTGFTHLEDGLNWDFALEYMNVESLDIGSFEEKEVDRYVEYTQLAFKDLEGGFL